MRYETKRIISVISITSITTPSSMGIARVVDWQYSSFHRFVKVGNYPTEWAGSGMRDLETVGME